MPKLRHVGIGVLIWGLWGIAVASEPLCLQLFAKKSVSEFDYHSQRVRNDLLALELRRAGILYNTLIEPPYFWKRVPGKPVPVFLKIKGFPEGHWLRAVQRDLLQNDISLYIYDDGHTASLVRYSLNGPTALLANNFAQLSDPTQQVRLAEHIIEVLSKHREDKIDDGFPVSKTMLMSENTGLQKPVFTFQDIWKQTNRVDLSLEFSHRYADAQNPFTQAALSYYVYTRQLLHRAKEVLPRALLHWLYYPDTIIRVNNGDLMIELHARMTDIYEVIFLEGAPYRGDFDQFFIDAKDLLEDLANDLGLLEADLLRAGVTIPDPFLPPVLSGTDFRKERREAILESLGISDAIALQIERELQSMRSLFESGSEVDAHLYQQSLLESKINDYTETIKQFPFAEITKFIAGSEEEILYYSRMNNKDAMAFSMGDKITLTHLSAGFTEKQKSRWQPNSNFYTVVILSKTGREVDFLQTLDIIHNQPYVLFMPETTFVVTEVNIDNRTITLREL